MTLSLSPTQTEELIQFSNRLADAAADVSLKHFRQPIQIEDKDDGEGFDPVTLADRGAEQAIRELIEATYPEHRIVGEEFGIKDTDSPFEWVLDPIDGTRAFISGLPTWGTLIALKHNGIPVIGVIDQPYVRERYVGWTTAATLNGKPIKTRKCSALEKATISTTDPDLFGPADRSIFDSVLERSRLVRYGLDCYAYAILSSGFFDVVMETGLQPYDMMALIPVVRGAGGSATCWSGTEPNENGKLLAVGDPVLAEIVLKLIHEMESNHG